MTTYPQNDFDLIAAVHQIFQRKLDDRERAVDLYRSLTNISWIHPERKVLGGLTWRVAAGEVADIRAKGEGYLDYYCAGNEGIVANWVRSEMAAHGWIPDASE